METGNNHRVRKMKYAGCLSGIPNLLFQHSTSYGFENQAQLVDWEVLLECTESYTSHNVVDFDAQFEEWALQYMVENNMSFPKSVDDSCALFTKLLTQVCE